jgi:cell division septum initiation protein DivIVA
MMKKAQRGKSKMTYADLLDKLIEENKQLRKELEELKAKIKESAPASN